MSIDDPLIIEKHREILRDKRAMKEVFAEFYDLCWALDERWLQGSGARVEIGAGSSFFKERYPSIATTDLKPAAHLDVVVDALDMPFEAASVRAYYCINCFHHFEDPSRFLRELLRTLVPGGGAILIEPASGVLARRFYRHVFDVEHFNPEQPSWLTTDSDLPPGCRGANQALSYVVFQRDRRRFEEEFPDLEIVLTRPIRSYLRYLLSGGLNFRQLVPGVAISVVKGVETLLAPALRHLALHHVILLRKRAEGREPAHGE